MIGGVNLHNVVRNAITTLHVDEPVDLFQSTGNQNVDGVVSPVFIHAGQVLVQIQSETADTLEPSREVNATNHSRRCYFYSDTKGGVIPQGIVRVFARGGDFIQRRDKTYWLVTAMLEDFSSAGWVCARIEEQLSFPENAIIKEPEDAPDIPPPDTD